MDILYKGFSTHNYVLSGGSFSVTNVDLVNLDILSHIFTEKNERVMLPGWGTDIPNAPFEPLTSELIQNIRDDIERVVNYDPRVELLTLTIAPYYDSNAIIASVTLQYIELNVSDALEFVLKLESGSI